MKDKFAKQYQQLKTKQPVQNVKKPIQIFWNCMNFKSFKITQVQRMCQNHPILREEDLFYYVLLLLVKVC